jgi:hypothetical protein
MTGILDKFHVEHGIQGAKVMGRSPQFTGYCTSDAEVDAAIQMLKDDLDACAREMKRLIEVNRRRLAPAGLVGADGLEPPTLSV